MFLSFHKANLLLLLSAAAAVVKAQSPDDITSVMVQRAEAQSMNNQTYKGD